MNKFQKLYESVMEGLSNIDVTKGRMHKVLGIPEDKEIKDVYKSGKKLAKDLVNKVGLKKAQGMLAFVANINKEDDIFDVALRNLPTNEKTLNENEDEIKTLLTQKKIIQDKLRNNPSDYPEENKINQEKMRIIDKKIKLVRDQDTIEDEVEKSQDQTNRLQKKKANDAKKEQ